MLTVAGTADDRRLPVSDRSGWPVTALRPAPVETERKGLMAVHLGLSSSGDRGLGLRQGQARRHGDRRSCDRGQPDRRRRERRRNRIRSLIFTALAFALPQSFKLTSMSMTPRASVSTWVDSVTPITPRQAYESAIQEAADRYHLEPALIRSVIQTESAFNALAVSPAGALGLMQLIPEVADEMGVQDPFNPRENIMAGARLLRNLMNHFKGNVNLTLAGYNAGPGAVARFRGRIPPFRETRDYLKRVNSLLAANRTASVDPHGVVAAAPSRDRHRGTARIGNTDVDTSRTSGEPWSARLASDRHRLTGCSRVHIAIA